MDEWGDSPRVPVTGKATPTLFLSIYLLLLAFFILLNSISTFQEVRSRAVMDSLSSTFATLLPARIQDPLVSQVGEVLETRSFQDKMARLFQTAIPATEVKIVQPGRLMLLVMPVDALFLPGKAELRPGRRPLLDRAVAAMAGPPAGLRYTAELTIGTPRPEAALLPIGETLETARLGAFAREMVARGCDPAALTVAMEHGDTRRIRLAFRSHVAETASPADGEGR